MPIELDEMRNQTWRAFLTAHARLVEAINRDLKATGVLPVDWYDVLLTLEEAPGQRLRMGDLAQAVLITPSGLTRLVDRIEAAGYLRREASPADRRVTYVAVTEAGLAARLRTWPVYSRAIVEHFGRFLGDREAALLRAALERMVAAHAEGGALGRSDSVETTGCAE